MQSSISFAKLLGYKEFFGAGGDKLFLANEIGKGNLTKLIPLLLKKASSKTSNEEFLAQLYTTEDCGFRNSPAFHAVYWKYLSLKTRYGGVALLSVEALLNLFIWLRGNGDISKHQQFDRTTPQKVFDLMLLFNDDILVQYEHLSESIEHFEDDRQLVRFIFSSGISYADLYYQDLHHLFLSQLYKAIELLNFLNNEEKYSTIYNKLLAEYGIKNLSDYVQKFGGAIMPVLKTPDASFHTLSIQELMEKTEASAILDELSIKENYDVEQNDYLSLRNKPLEKISEDEYLVIYDLFLIKKLYTGLIFKLSGFDKNFLGNIRKDFSEGVLLYKSLDFIAANTGGVKITGSDFENNGIDGSIDYLLRYDENLFLFEAKDFFIPGSAKLSYDFDKIENELKKDGRLLKASKQLVKNIKLFIESKLTEEINSKNIKNIYPIIVVYDNLYSVPALNHWINYWFQDELSTIQDIVPDHLNIYPLTLMEIDDLILLKETITNAKIDFATLIIEFHSYVNYAKRNINYPQDFTNYVHCCSLPFHDFIWSYIWDKKINFEMGEIMNKMKEAGLP